MLYKDAEGNPDPDAQSDAQLITLLRILDVVSAQLALAHPDEARRLFDLHERGGLGYTQIAFNPNEML